MQAACSHTNRLYMNPGNPVTCHELYFDAKGGGLWAGGLGSRSGLCSGLEESFENRLGVHFRSGLRGGSLTGRAGWRRQTVFFCAIAGAWSVAEPPVENQGAKKTHCHTHINKSHPLCLLKEPQRLSDSFIHSLEYTESLPEYLVMLML